MKKEWEQEVIDQEYTSSFPRPRPLCMYLSRERHQHSQARTVAVKDPIYVQ